jgi:hypothetical protein
LGPFYAAVEAPLDLEEEEEEEDLSLLREVVEW